MSNPYASPTQPEHAREPLDSDRVSRMSMPKRVLCFLCFACGCVLTFHVVVAIQQGPAEAIFRTLREPSAAMAFFAICVSACFAAVTGWKVIRSRLFSGYVAMPFTQFASGAILVALFPFVRATLVRITRSMAAGAGGFDADLLHTLTGLCALVVAAVLAVELEALFVRFLNRVRVRSGEQADVASSTNLV